MKKFFVLAAMLALAGCSHRLELHQRGGPATGQGIAHQNDQSVEIQLAGKTYKGTYAYASGGSNGSFFGNVRGKPFYGFSSGGGMGSGNVIAKSEDGSGLRCQFQYSTTNNQGVGECQDDAGATYDLQIRMGS